MFSKARSSGARIAVAVAALLVAMTLAAPVRADSDSELANPLSFALGEGNQSDLAMPYLDGVPTIGDAETLKQKAPLAVTISDAGVSGFRPGVVTGKAAPDGRFFASFTYIDDERTLTLESWTKNGPFVYRVQANGPVLEVAQRDVDGLPALSRLATAAVEKTEGPREVFFLSSGVIYHVKAIAFSSNEEVLAVAEHLAATVAHDPVEPAAPATGSGLPPAINDRHGMPNPLLSAMLLAALLGLSLAIWQYRYPPA